MDLAERKLRILALHGSRSRAGHRPADVTANKTTGFAQNGHIARLKFRRLQILLEDRVRHAYPGGVELVCPDGPIILQSNDIFHGGATHSDSSHPNEDGEDQLITEAFNRRAFWRRLDNVNRYSELYPSLRMLATMLQADPVDGIFAFSQGATLATMLISLCEGTPERMQSLASQGAPCDLAAPQAPFKFAVLSCGYRGTDEFYHGFYEPKLSTPILFNTAKYDHMIPPDVSAVWATSSEHGHEVSHLGGHFFPTNHDTINEMVDFLVPLCIDPGLPSTCHHAPYGLNGGVGFGDECYPWFAGKTFTREAEQCDPDESTIVTPTSPSTASTPSLSSGTSSAASSRSFQRMRRRRIIVTRTRVVRI